MGDLAVRSSVPYDKAANERLQSWSQHRCLTFPSVCTALLLAVSCRARYAPSEKLGLARFDTDQLAFERLMNGMISYFPQTATLDFRIDDRATRYLDQIDGRRPTKVLFNLDLSNICSHFVFFDRHSDDRDDDDDDDDEDRRRQL